MTILCFPVPTENQMRWPIFVCFLNHSNLMITQIGSVKHKSLQILCKPVLCLLNKNYFLSISFLDFLQFLKHKQKCNFPLEVPVTMVFTACCWLIFLYSLGSWVVLLWGRVGCASSSVGSRMFSRIDTGLLTIGICGIGSVCISSSVPILVMGKLLDEDG